MKKTYVEKITIKRAWRANKKCKCGQNIYLLVELLEPVSSHRWSVRCSSCDRETDTFLTKEEAMAAWMKVKTYD